MFAYSGGNAYVGFESSAFWVVDECKAESAGNNVLTAERG